MTGEWLTVDDGAELHRLPAVWLRDNVPSGRHRRAGQRTFDINLVPRPILIEGAAESEGEVIVTFSDGTTDRFPIAFLTADRSRPASRRLWDRSLQEDPPTHDWASVAGDGGKKLAWLGDIRDLGFAVISGVPEAVGVTGVVAEFGYVRETNYGSTFDVMIENDPNNLAFTSVDIGPHTDNPYRDPVPGVQLLHCLVRAETGGLTRLTDGLAAVTWLEDAYPDAVELLERHPVTFEFVDLPTTHLVARHPLIERDAEGRFSTIRFNSRSAAPFDVPTAELPAFYTAYRRLGSAVRNPRFTVELMLEEGDLIAFDNRRILHGRTAFTGSRHLVGCYADHDGLESTIRVLEASDRPGG